jgi:predicted PurR-regulated permease PerM
VIANRPWRKRAEIAVRLGMLGFVVFWCFQIVALFVGIDAWGLIIAIGASGPYEAMAKAIGGRRGFASTAFVIVALAVIIVPAVLLSDSLISGSQYFAQEVADGSMEVPPPPSHIAEWPVIGQSLFDTWTLASKNLTAAIEPLGPQLKAVSASLLRAAGSAGAELLQLIASLVLAGFLLSRGEQCPTATRWSSANAESNLSLRQPSAANRNSVWGLVRSHHPSRVARGARHGLRDSASPRRELFGANIWSPPT